MNLLEDVRIKLCDHLVKEYNLSKKNILDYNIMSSHDDRENINVIVSTDKEEYTFSLTMIKHEENKTAEHLKNYPMVPLVDSGILIALNGFEITGYIPADEEKVDLIHVEAILTHLAYIDSKDIKENSLKPTLRRPGYSYIIENYKEHQDILLNFIQYANMEDIDPILLKDGIKKLLDSSEDTLKQTEENVYVRSNILNSKLFFKLMDDATIECKIVNMASETYVPLVYDVLLAIFSFSDQELRKCHFHHLLDFYYKTLEANLHKLNFNLSTILPMEAYQRQIKQFIPYVKLEIALYCTRLFSKEWRTLDETNNMAVVSFINANEKQIDLFQVATRELYECALYRNLNREDCYKIVRNKFGSNNNYKFISWTITPLEDKPGYLGDYFKLKININHDEEDKTLHLFAKYLPTNDSVKEMASLSFKKEQFFYETFINELNQLGLEEITDFLPKCYFSRSEDVLILDDISLLNYRSFATDGFISYESVHIVIKQLAKIHACSLLYEEIMTEKSGEKVRIDDKFNEYLKEISLQTEIDNDPKKLMMCGINTVLNYLLDVFPDISKEITIKEFKSKVKEAFDASFLKVQKSDKYRNVICQGDFWGSNIMFQFNKYNSPINCCIVDYQLIRYCPPTNDLMFLLYVNLDKQTRTNYMSKLLNEYYMELVKTFKKYHFDLSKIYTYEEFLDCCTYMKSFGPCIASLYLPVTLCSTEIMKPIMADDKKLERLLTVDRKEVIDQVYTDGLYRQRLRNVVEDLYDICKSDCI